MEFTREIDFEKALIEILKSKGWANEIIQNPTEQDLINNWAAILFENNRGIDQLNDCPLTDGEMQQILEQIAEKRTPLKLNGFINGKTISVKRDNPHDTIHCGKEVSLKIYDRLEIAGGQSRYQIAEQPIFKTASHMLNDRRGDLMLLINGMPLIHIELKRSGISVSQATNQIEKYAGEGVFTGIFSLVQIFVAMEPEEAVYFANPGPDGRFNPNYFFHWADFNNEPENHWKQVAADLLSIPMAHQMIGFYTVADDTDGVLKVMRSYQVYAAQKISDTVAKIKWDGDHTLGGYVWHTTGSGKTMTSFKSAQLIANSKDADKVVFLMDRIELGNQSLTEYKGFADDDEDVQATENTVRLVGKLKSDNPSDTLIVTSIQKMSNIKDEEAGVNARDLQKMQAKRIVFIIDEAHRSTFGDMLSTIKKTFPKAVFFGFTGTPIQKENQKKSNTTATIFGNELHRYSIADGIRDKNVLGFDPYMVLTFKDQDLRTQVALMKAKAANVQEVMKDPQKKKIYYHYIDEVKMAGYEDENNKHVNGIEDYVPTVQYETSQHQNMVVEDIRSNWMTLSHDSMFHAIFATSSIPEAITYYRLLKKNFPELRTTALFDPNIDNDGGVKFKEDGLVEIMEDYDLTYGQNYTLETHALFKKDIVSRLSHKEPYKRIDLEPEKRLDLLIVVDQMLTGFDSKWVNTLYMDKLLEYANIIQAFSRTNRLFGPEKPFGTIRYYRYPHTMKANVEKAVKLYSGDKPLGLFVQHLDYNLNMMNSTFVQIRELFHNAQIDNFEKLPAGKEERGKFAKLFHEWNEYFEAAKVQGFVWGKPEYHIRDEEGNEKAVITLTFDQNTYLTLALRYKELSGGSGSSDSGDVPFDIDGHLLEIDTGHIDTAYMNSRFDKFMVTLQQDNVSEEEMQHTLDELHKSFAMLVQEDQKYANIFLHDVQSGEAKLVEGKTFRDYITEYASNAKNDHIHRIAEELGLDEDKLRQMMSAAVTNTNINEFGRFDELKKSVDYEKARQYFAQLDGNALPPFKVRIKVEQMLKEFILNGGNL